MQNPHVLKSNSFLLSFIGMTGTVLLAVLLISPAWANVSDGRQKVETYKAAMSAFIGEISVSGYIGRRMSTAPSYLIS